MNYAKGGDREYGAVQAMIDGGPDKNREANEKKDQFTKENQPGQTKRHSIGLRRIKQRLHPDDRRQNFE